MGLDLADASAGARRLHEYWTEKRRDRSMPLRKEIDPTEIHELLPNVAILDIEDEDGKTFFRHRLVGTGVVDALGKDSTGRRVGENLGGSWLEHFFYDTLLEVARSGEPNLVHLDDPWSSAKRLERLILPLAHEDMAPGKLILYFAVVYDAINPQPYVEATGPDREPS